MRNVMILSFPVLLAGATVSFAADRLPADGGAGAQSSYVATEIPGRGVSPVHVSLAESASACAKAAASMSVAFGNATRWIMLDRSGATRASGTCRRTDCTGIDANNLAR